MMKYVIWTIIGFIILTVLYGIYDSFKNYLIKKYKYEFYDDSLLYSLMVSEITGGLALGLFFSEVPSGVLIVLSTISVIFASIVLINNIMSTTVLCGIFVTILQALFTIYIMLMFVILKEQLKQIFSSKPDK